MPRLGSSSRVYCRTLEWDLSSKADLSIGTFLTHLDLQSTTHWSFHPCLVSNLDPSTSSWCTPLGLVCSHTCLFGSSSKQCSLRLWINPVLKNLNNNCVFCSKILIYNFELYKVPNWLTYIYDYGYVLVQFLVTNKMYISTIFGVQNKI